MISPVHVIINAGSGSVLADETAKSLRERFIAFGINAEIHLATSGREIVQLARDAADGDRDIIIAGGGDGTIGTIAAEATRTGKILGVLPLGTLNNFSKDIGIPQTLNEAIRNIAEGEVREIDIAEVNGRIFINNSSIGLYPKMVVSRQKQQQKLGRGKWSAAFWASLKLFRLSPFLRVSIELDGKVFERKTPFVFVGNNEYEMEMYNIGRRQSLDDGKLSLYFLHREGRRGLVMLVWKTLTGGLRQWKDFEAVATDHVTIRTRRRRLRVAFDGETTLVEPPLEYRIRPKALKVIVPMQKPAGEHRRNDQLEG